LSSLRLKLGPSKRLMEALHPPESAARRMAAAQRMGKEPALPPFVEWLKRIMIRTFTANL
jgi:hypothetical protein